jgi:hypothetical protein
MSMLMQGPEKEAKLVEQKTGVPTTAAVDGMTLNFGDVVQTEMSKQKSPRDLTSFL